MSPVNLPKTPRELLIASTSLIAISYATLRFLKALGNKSGYKKGPEQIGCRVSGSKEPISDISHPEFDVIIIGGGELYSGRLCLEVNKMELFKRNIGMRFSFSSLRGS